jgi:putative ABC transport system permease protein
MGTLGRQILAVTRMNLRSLPRRFWMSAATVLAVGLVVGVLLSFLALANGFHATLQGTGSPDVAMILRDRAQSEINSSLTREQVELIEAAPGLKRDANGRALLSPELYVVVDGLRRSTKIKANLPLRGVGERAFEVRRGLSIVQGRMFEAGRNELVVGKAVSKEFEGFELGRSIRLGSQSWTVVGIFEAGGTVFESEIWADIAIIQGIYLRGGSVQSVRARLESPASLEAVRAYLKADPRLKLEVVDERSYFERQAQTIVNLVFYLGWPLAILMSFGALAGALNTMYAAVDARTKEIATLRALGFNGLAAFAGTMNEALFLSLLGGIVGALGAYALFQGLTASTLSDSFTQVVFALKFSLDMVGRAMLLALAIGFLGGLFPAFRAARVPLLAAFRDA